MGYTDEDGYYVGDVGGRLRYRMGSDRLLANTAEAAALQDRVIADVVDRNDPDSFDLYVFGKAKFSDGTDGEALWALTIRDGVVEKIRVIP